MGAEAFAIAGMPIHLPTDRAGDGIATFSAQPHRSPRSTSEAMGSRHGVGSHYGDAARARRSSAASSLTRFENRVSLGKFVGTAKIARHWSVVSA